MDEQTAPQPPVQPTVSAPPGSPAQPTQPMPQSAQAPGSAPYGQQPGQPFGQQPAGYYQPVPPQSNGKAVGALVCGILAILFSASILFGIALGIVAIVLAGQAVKQAGRDGKATGGKVCGIVGIVLSVLAFVLYVVIGVGVLAFVVGASDEYDRTYSLESSDLSSITQGDQQMEAAASEKLDLLKSKDAVLMRKIADQADEQLADATGYSLTDLGIDPLTFVEWMLVDFDYQLDGAYDNGDGTGTVYADVTLRDSMAFATTFMEDAQAAIDTGDLQSLDEAGAKVLLGELYQAAMDKTTAMTTDYVSLEVVKNGDSWQVDEDSWGDELDYLFGL